MTFDEFGKNIAIMRYDDPNNLITMFQKTLQKYPSNLSIGEKNSQGIYEWITYKELGVRVDNLRSGLHSLGFLTEDDAIGIIANNRTEWVVGEMATYGLKCRWIPMYEKELLQTWKYVVQDSGMKVLFVANEQIYEQLKHFTEEIPSLQKIYVIDSKEENSMRALEKIGESQFIEAKIPGPEDPAALIYTSGTTGDPKGVILTHGNFTSNYQAGANVFPHLNSTDRGLSILPWAHSYALTAELHVMLSLGASLGITSVETMSDDLIKVNPSILICVPRLFNKIYNGIHAKMEEEGGMVEKLFYMAKAAAKKKRETGKAGLKYKLLNKVVFGKVRAKFGTRLRESLTASAKTELEVATFFYDIGLPIYDCYGMTETAPAITLNAPKAHRLGSVGKPIEKVKVVIDKSVTGVDSPDGEVICYGPNVMKGYHNKPEQTAAVMMEDENGIKGMRTGDLGRIDQDGFLFITGRIKTEYKLLNGKYVHPAAIEEYIKLLPQVVNVMLYGDGREYNVCLVVPDPSGLVHIAKTKNIDEKDPKKLVENLEIQKFIKEKILEHLKGNFGGYEIPRKFMFIAEDFSVDNGLLTQTLKLKRKKVIQKYESLINSLYDTDAM